jgi:DNA transposition AAA+ family ATPase
VDEVHRVFTNYQKSSVMRCLDVLRYIHDKTGCGMVLSGTNVFRNELQEGSFKQYLKQLQRRGLYEIQLPDMPPREDLDLIAKHYGLRPAAGDAERTMLRLVEKNGLAAFFTRLDDAVEMASKRKQDVTWELFEKAVSFVEKMKK